MSEKSVKKIDYLKEDPAIYGQKWVCLSFLTPETIKMKSDVRSVKVRGVYGSEEEARRRCEEIRHFDQDFNVFIAPVGQWLPWCDDPDKASDFNYANDKLNNMMKSYYENQAQAKDHFEQRKAEMVQKSIKENEERKKENERNARKKTLNKKQSNSIEDDITIEEVETECNKQLEEEQKLLTEREEKVKEALDNIGDIDDELQKAEELYKKMLEEEN